MKARFYIFAVVLAAVSGISASAQDESHFKFYGFIRNYAHMDTKVNKSGTAELFNYLPENSRVNYDGNTMSYHFTSITSRVGVDVSGYEFNGMKVGAKIESDFYSGVSGVTGTATLRLRQAYMTLGFENGANFKIGQAWHPMAADMPDVISLNSGAPFGPFSRTPLLQVDQKFKEDLGYTAALIWQQQYASCGPEGASANYLKYSGIPEIYLGLNYTTARALFRIGADFLSIKPFYGGNRLNELTLFAYAQYKEDLFSIKAKTALAQDGSHLNLNGGYALSGWSTFTDETTWDFTPTLSSSSWVSLSYGKDWQGVLFAGFVKNFGTMDGISAASQFYFSKNSSKEIEKMFRLSPTIIRNLGKVTLGLECEITSVLYGTDLNLNKGLYQNGEDWLTNTRLQMMLKYTF